MRTSPSIQLHVNIANMTPRERMFEAAKMRKYLGHRSGASLTYLALEPDVKLPCEVFDLLKLAGIKMDIHDNRGTFLVYDSTIHLLHQRDLGLSELKPFATYDLELEVALHQFLGKLSITEFRMVRCGEGRGLRGGWVDHPFRDISEVISIEADAGHPCLLRT